MKQEQMKQELNTQEIVMDASKAVLGRLASKVAKISLSGTRVVIVNSAKAIITGNKKDILSSYLAKRARGGSAQKGPYFPSTSAMIMKRTVRGMLAHRKGRGSEAFKRVTCFDDVPEAYAGKEKIKSEGKYIKFITLKELSIALRG